MLSISVSSEITCFRSLTSKYEDDIDIHHVRLRDHAEADYDLYMQRKLEGANFVRKPKLLKESDEAPVEVSKPPGQRCSIYYGALSCPHEIMNREL